MRQTIVVLKKDRLEVFRVEEGVKTATAETEWSAESLADKLKMVKTKFETEAVRVLIAREIAGTEMIKDTLSEAAVEAKLKVEMVEEEGLEEGKGDKIVELAGEGEGDSNIEHSNIGGEGKGKGEGKDKVKMMTEVVEEVKVNNEQRIVNDEDKRVKSVGKPIMKRELKWVWISLGGLLVIGVVVGGILRVRLTSKPSEPEVVAVPVVATPSPSPSPEPVDLATLTVSVLNGAGVAGEAGRVKALLVGEGFSEDKITTDNASNYDYVKTEVQVKAGMDEQVLATIKEALGTKYEVVAGKELSESSDDDVVVIVGVREGAVQGAKTESTKTEVKVASESAETSEEATESGQTSQ